MCVLIEIQSARNYGVACQMNDVRPYQKILMGSCSVRFSCDTNNNRNCGKHQALRFIWAKFNSFIVSDIKLKGLSIYDLSMEFVCEAYFCSIL